MMIGKQSIRFRKPPYIKAAACVAGKKEGEGPYGALFHKIIEDPNAGGKNWEEAESSLMKESIEMVLAKADMTAEQIRFLFAGDLLGQLIATSFGVMDFQIPHYGIYGACSSAGEGIALAAMTVAGGFANHAIAAVSSHFGSAEKQFRFPLEYGNQRPFSSTWTVTGGGAFLISDEPSELVIPSITTGKIVDYGVKDSMNMGAAMAPAAANVIYQHFQDFQTSPEEYDRIITGDLGVVGQKLLWQLLEENGYDIQRQHMDCGIEIYCPEEQNTHAGGSGCACSAVMLAAHILPKIRNGEWKRVLFVPTGALLSTVSFNEGQTVPGIAHGVVIERSSR